MNKAKLFICYHPGILLLYKNLIKIIRRHDKDSKIILFKVGHPYFKRFNFEFYKKYFDKIIEFDFIDYEKNFLASYWKILNFKNKLKKTMVGLSRDFGTIDLFLENSAWLPVNILLYNLNKEKNIKSINRLDLLKLESLQTKADKIKTFLCGLYSLPFRCYKINVKSSVFGGINFVYADQVPGVHIRIIAPTIQTSSNSDWGKENILPYPVISESSPTGKKDMIIIFGDAGIYQYSSQYLPSYEIFVEKLSAFFRAIEKKYSHCKLYYKPHPGDEDRIMPGINLKKYSLFDNKVDAQVLSDKYQEKIKAVYTFSSSAVIFSSFFGIPSYSFHRYLCNQGAGDRFGYFLNQDHVKSKFLFHISNLKEIGKIDDLERPKPFDLNNISDKYRKLLKITFK